MKVTGSSAGGRDICRVREVRSVKDVKMVESADRSYLPSQLMPGGESDRHRAGTQQSLWSASDGGEQLESLWASGP
jgi:hypothetical protein